MMGLPIEVLEIIIDYVPYQYLTNVLFTCSHLKEYALRRLWEHVTISLDSPEDPEDTPMGSPSHSPWQWPLYAPRKPKSGYSPCVRNTSIGSGPWFRDMDSSYDCRQGWVKIDSRLLLRGSEGLESLRSGPFKYVKTLSITVGEDANDRLCDSIMDYIVGWRELDPLTPDGQYAEFLSSLGQFFPMFAQRQFPDAVFHVKGEKLDRRLPVSVDTPGFGAIESLTLSSIDVGNAYERILYEEFEDFLDMNFPALRFLHIDVEGTTLVSSQKLKRFFDNCPNLRILTMLSIYSSDYSLEWIPESVTHLTLGSIIDPAVEPQENHHPRKVLANVTDFCLFYKLDIPFFDAEMPNIRHLVLDCFTSRNESLINSILSPSSHSIKSLISDDTPYEVLHLINGILKRLEQVVVSLYESNEAVERMTDFVQNLQGLKTMALTHNYLFDIEPKELLRVLAPNNPALKEIIFSDMSKEVALSLGQAIPLRELRTWPGFFLQFGVYPDEHMQKQLGSDPD